MVFWNPNYFLIDIPHQMLPNNHRNGIFNLESWLTMATMRKLAVDNRNLTFQRSNPGNISVKFGSNSKKKKKTQQQPPPNIDTDLWLLWVLTHHRYARKKENLPSEVHSQLYKCKAAAMYHKNILYLFMPDKQGDYWEKTFYYVIP